MGTTGIKIEQKVIELTRKHIKHLNVERKLEITEIGDGNINYIYKISDGESNVIAKFADVYFRGSTREISTKRSNIENFILNVQNDILPGCVPKVYYFDEENHCIFMEDLSNYDTLRDALRNEKIIPVLSKQISKILFNTLFKTTDLVLESDLKKNRVKKMVNTEMCEISERLVFTEPYLNLNKQNKFHEENEQFVRENLYDDKHLLKEIALLKNNFKNNSQSMIHGDLHAGSIFVKEDDVKVFDPEFSFYGPMGYDIGNVIGNLIIYYVYGKLNCQREEYTKWLLNTITEQIDLFNEEFNYNFEKCVIDPVLKTAEFKKEYLNEILSDSMGFAGTEIIRRTVGAFKVPVLTDCKKEILYNLERNLIKISKKLILDRSRIKSSEDLKNIMKENINV